MTELKNLGGEILHAGHFLVLCFVLFWWGCF